MLPQGTISANRFIIESANTGTNTATELGIASQGYYSISSKIIIFPSTYPAPSFFTEGEEPAFNDANAALFDHLQRIVNGMITNADQLSRFNQQILVRQIRKVIQNRLTYPDHATIPVVQLLNNLKQLAPNSAHKGLVEEYFIAFFTEYLIEICQNFRFNPQTSQQLRAYMNQVYQLRTSTYCSGYFVELWLNYRLNIILCGILELLGWSLFFIFNTVDKSNQKNWAVPVLTLFLPIGITLSDRLLSHLYWAYYTFPKVIANTRTGNPLAGVTTRLLGAGAQKLLKDLGGPSYSEMAVGYVMTKLGCC